MVFVYLLRYITGFVSFRAYGGFAERFINLCSSNGITLWDVSIYKDTVYASTTVDGYKNIISAARNSGMRTKVISKKGVPFIFFRLRHRFGLAAGALILILSLSFLSGRIWLIDVSGNNQIPDEAVIAAINDAGIKIGVKRSSFNGAQCAVEAESEFDNIARISVNIIGSCAKINVKENPARPGVIDNSGYYNVVSNADAQLVVLETYSGMAQAKLFNSVIKGQTLISGINQNKDETVSYVHAHGYAVGRTEKIIESAVDNKQTLYCISKIKKVYHLFILGKKITFGNAPEKYDFKFDSEKYLELNNKRMPVGFFCTEYSSSENTDKKLTSKEIRLINAEDFADKAETYCETRQVIDIKIQDDKDKIKGKFTCFENLGEEKPFEVSEME